MPAVSGVDFIVQVNTGTEAAPVWTAVGGQRGATLNMGTDEIDTTSKDSAGWHEGLPSIRNWSLDFDALLIQGDAGLTALENMFMNHTQVQVRLSTPSAATYTGKATLTDFSYEGPHDGEATASGSLTGTGALTKA